jgi:hypothetical protein
MPSVTKPRSGLKGQGMILNAAQYYSFWYFGYPTPLAPGEDRSA